MGGQGWKASKGLLSYESFKEIFRFVFVGGVSFAVDMAVLALLQEAGLKRVHNGVLISTAGGFVVSVVLHYILASKWVFRDHSVHTKGAHVTALSLFILTNVIGLSINEVMMWLGVTIFDFHYMLVKSVAAGVVMFWNFTCQKFMIFRSVK